MQRVALEKACIERVKNKVEGGEIKSRTDLISEIMINFDPKLGYSKEIIEPIKLLFYYPDLAHSLGRVLTGTTAISESLKRLEKNFQAYQQITMPDRFVYLKEWKNQHSPIDLALYKDYPKILGYPSLRPYRNFLLDRYVRRGTILVYHFPEKFSDWTMTYVQEKALNPSEALKEEYRLERRICKVEGFQEIDEANRLANKLIGGEIPVWKYLFHSKDLRREATITNVGLNNFRMIKYFGRPPEKVEREKEIIVSLAQQMINGTSYTKVNRVYVKEMEKIYPWEPKVWLPFMGLARWRMMVFSPTPIRKKLLEKRLLGQDSIKAYLQAKNVFYSKYPHLVAI